MAGSTTVSEPPSFDDGFRKQLAELIRWRRDVRSFRRDPIDPDLVDALLMSADQAPSVGNSQPWRFVLVESEERREGVRESFRRANARALAGYCGERAALYARLKLEGLSQAPVHIAAFCDTETGQGAGLGRATMPETLAYSVVTSVGTLWLAARAHGIGVGWVSILEPEVVTRLLDVPSTWRLIAYLCLGLPSADHVVPELERAGWQARTDLKDKVVRR